MQKIDPIINGNDIFQSVLCKYSDSITNINEAVSLIQEIVDETEGWVIVDFLDYGGWDKLTKVEVDISQGLLFLIDNEVDAKGFVKKAPPFTSRDGLVLKFKDLKTYSSQKLSGIFLRGYTLQEKNIKKIFSRNSTDLQIIENRNFAISLERISNNINESLDILNCPIYSVAIIPKNSPLSAGDSQELLFTINFHDCLKRLQLKKSQLLNVPANDEDSLCEKANTGRRIFEFILKIECCLIEHKVSFIGYERKVSASFKKDYDKLLLGDLRKLINDFKPDNRKSDLLKIVLTSNKLSHDSGEPIQKQEVIDLFDLMIDYCLELTEIIKDHSRVNNYYTSRLKKVTRDNIHLKTISFSDVKIKESSK